MAANNDIGAEAAPPPPSRPSRWEWLPVAAVPLLAALHFLRWTPGRGGFAGSSPDFLRSPCLLLALGLLPGALWRLSGRGAWKIHRLGLAGGLMAIVLGNPDLRPDASIWRSVSTHWRLTALGFAVSFTQPIWGALRLHRLLADSGIPGTRLKTFRLCLAGSFFNVFLPGSTGGDIYRTYAVSRDAALRPALASVTLDRLLGLPPLILLLGLGMACDRTFLADSRLLAGTVPIVAAAGAVCLALLAYLALAGKSRRRRDAGDLREPASGGWLRRLHLLAADNVRRPATLPLVMLYGFLAHFCTVASCLCFGEALGVSGLPWTRYLLVVPLAMAVNAVPGAPGGAGQGELAMAALLDLAAPGAGNAQAGVAVMLLFRLSNLGIGLGGAAAYAMGGDGAPPGGKPPWP